MRIAEHPHPAGLRRRMAVCITVALVACSQDPAPPRDVSGTASNQEVSSMTVVIPIEGMSCASCTARVKRTLTSLDGVTNVEVDLGERRARVSFDATKLTAGRLVTEINALGYTAGTPTEPRP